MTLLFSKNEVYSLVRKAGIGSGLAEGIATELASLVSKLTLNDRETDAVHGDVVNFLEQHQEIGSKELAIIGSEISLTDPDYSSLLYGLELLNSEPDLEEILISGINFPNLFLACLRIKAHQFSVDYVMKIASDDLSLLHSEPGYILSLIKTSSVKFSEKQIDPNAKKENVSDCRLGGLYMNKENWDRLQSFAARTYVPASEASRLAGAGAGTIDND